MKHLKTITSLTILLLVTILFAEDRLSSYSVVRNNMFASLNASIDLDKWRKSGIELNSADDVRDKFIGTMDKMYNPKLYTSNPYDELEEMVYDLTNGSFENSSYRMENFARAHTRVVNNAPLYKDRQYIITRIQETKYFLISADVEPWGVEVYNDGQYKVLYHSAFKTHGGHSWQTPFVWEAMEFEVEDGIKTHRLVIQNNSLMIFPATKATACMMKKDANKKLRSSSMPQYKHQLKLFSLLKIREVVKKERKTGTHFIMKVDVVQSALVHKDKDTAMYSIYYK